MTQDSVRRRLSVSKIRSTVGIGASKHRAKERPAGPEQFLTAAGRQASRFAGQSDEAA